MSATVSGDGIDLALQSLEKARRAGWARAYENERLQKQLQAELLNAQAREQQIIDVTRALLSSDRSDVASWFLWLEGSAAVRQDWPPIDSDDSLYIACRLVDYFDQVHPVIPQDDLQ